MYMLYCQTKFNSRTCSLSGKMFRSFIIVFATCNCVRNFHVIKNRVWVWGFHVIDILIRRPANEVVVSVAVAQ